MLLPEATVTLLFIPAANLSVLNSITNRAYPAPWSGLQRISGRRAREKERPGGGRLRAACPAKGDERGATAGMGEAAPFAGLPGKKDDLSGG
jgi:hypothetical protein